MQFETLKELGKESGIGGEQGGHPYHYGSHYSNLAGVLHYLVRLQPYTQHFVNFQGICRYYVGHSDSFTITCNLVATSLC